eukprot:evm.model.NODE_27596_length_23439_cov_34.245060.1
MQNLSSFRDRRLLGQRAIHEVKTLKGTTVGVLGPLDGEEGRGNMSRENWKKHAASIFFSKQESHTR